MGGTRVTVVGTGFKSGTTKCQFGSLNPSSATYVSQTQVVCISPGSDTSSGRLALEVTTDNSGAADTYSVDGVLFAYQGEVTQFFLLFIMRQNPCTKLCIALSCNCCRHF